MLRAVVRSVGLLAAWSLCCVTVVWVVLCYVERCCCGVCGGFEVSFEVRYGMGTGGLKGSVGLVELVPRDTVGVEVSWPCVDSVGEGVEWRSLGRVRGVGVRGVGVGVGGV